MGRQKLIWTQTLSYTLNSAYIYTYTLYTHVSTHAYIHRYIYTLFLQNRYPLFQENYLHMVSSAMSCSLSCSFWQLCSAPKQTSFIFSFGMVFFPRRVNTLAACHTSENQLILECSGALALCCLKMTSNGVKSDRVGLLWGKWYPGFLFEVHSLQEMQTTL